MLRLLRFYGWTDVTRKANLLLERVFWVLVTGQWTSRKSTKTLSPRVGVQVHLIFALDALQACDCVDP